MRLFVCGRSKEHHREYGQRSKEHHREYGQRSKEHHREYDQRLKEHGLRSSGVDKLGHGWAAPNHLPFF